MLITGAPDVLFRLCQHQQTQNGLEPFNLHYWEEKIEEYAREDCAWWLRHGNRPPAGSAS